MFSQMTRWSLIPTSTLLSSMMPAWRFKPSTLPRDPITFKLLVSTSIFFIYQIHLHSNIADDEFEDEGGETVINVVDAHNLQEQTLSKKEPN